MLSTYAFFYFSYECFSQPAASFIIYLFIDHHTGTQNINHLLFSPLTNIEQHIFKYICIYTIGAWGKKVTDKTDIQQKKSL